MSFLTTLAGIVLFTSSSLIQSVHARPAPIALPDPVIVDPNGDAVTISPNNTINATTPATAPKPDNVPSANLALNLVNYLSGNVNAYVTGLNANNQLVFLGPDGEFFYPNTSESTPQPIENSAIAIPMGAQGTNTTATIPGYLSASRVWFSVGELQFFVVQTGNGPGLVEPALVNPSDPNANINYGFGELTWIEGGGLYADISFVDAVGMPIGLELSTTDGTASQQALGLPSTAVQDICNDLKSQSAVDGQPWGDACVYDPSGNLLRVLAPIDQLSSNSSAYSGYFDDYIQSVFETFSTNTLTIDTQAAAGVVNCTADTGSMTITCDGDNRPYAAPTAADVFGCNSGPFGIEEGDNGVHYAVVPRLCAAFNRGTLLLPPGASSSTDLSRRDGSYCVQPSLPPTSYYGGGLVSAAGNSTVAGTGVWNYYSEFVHKYEWNGLGYAFSYDDVAPADNENVAGLVASANPGTLTFLVGGYDLA